jgi:hypothetical protein
MLQNQKLKVWEKTAESFRITCPWLLLYARDGLS